jgi:hypothetical protein
LNAPITPTIVSLRIISSVTIAVNFRDGERVNAGRAFGVEHAHISISVGVETTAAEFADEVGY